MVVCRYMPRLSLPKKNLRFLCQVLLTISHHAFHKYMIRLQAETASYRRFVRQDVPVKSLLPDFLYFQVSFDIPLLKEKGRRKLRPKPIISFFCFLSVNIQSRQ